MTTAVAESRGLANALDLSALPRRRKGFLKFSERLIEAGLLMAGLFSVGTTVAIIVVLIRECQNFFAQPEVTFWEFITGRQWNPLLGGEKHFGIWPLVCGTVMVTVVAMAVALPMGLVTAVYLSEYAPKKLRNVLKPALEILAGIPTVVLGFFALTVITPTLQWMHGGFEGYNIFSAGLAIGILCVPIVCSLSEDALRAVPRSLREAAYGVGATKFDVSVKVVVPAALSGIVAAFLLAVARAVGETMVVALAAGNTPKMTLDVRQEAQTMTAYIVQIFLGDVRHGGLAYLSCYAVAMSLFVMTLALTIIGHRIRVKYREVYY